MCYVINVISLKEILLMNYFYMKIISLAYNVYSNACNMGMKDLPDIKGIHIRQITNAYVTGII